MKKIKLLVDTRVYLLKESVIEVTEEEARRLLSLGFAKEEKKKEKKAK